MQDVYGPLASRADQGIGSLLDSNDIAIIALTTCLIFALIGNIVQYFVGNHRQEKDFDRFLAVTKAMVGLESAIDEMKSIFALIYQKGVANVSSDKQ